MARHRLAPLIPLVLLLPLLSIAGCERKPPVDPAVNQGDPKNPGRAKQSGKDRNAALTLYCAAGIKPPVEKVIKQYEQALGVTVQVQYGGSGTLLSNIQIAKTGDLYLAADQSYIDIAREKGVVAEAIPLAHLTPVIAVKRGNPKNIKTLQDLLRDDVAVALANPDAASVGKTTRKVLTKTGHWEELKEHTRVFKPTVNEVANDVLLGAVDAAVIWDAVANQLDGLEAVRVDAFEKAGKQITIGVLKSAKDPAAALRFARFLGARDRGLLVFKELGYPPVQGDVWAKHPEVLIYSGAMLRPGLEQALRRFEAREGVTINTVYNGCGVLVSQMKSGATPEAYLSCDVSFMTDVRERFRPATILTENDMVLLVGKGNPKRIAGVRDLTKPGVRLGVAHEEKSALGALTARMLRRAKMYDAVQANKAVDSATGDFLVNQIRAGSLDVVIVYRSNAMASDANRDHLEIVEIDLPDATAVQPIAIAKKADHAFLLERFFEAIRTDVARGEFESFGFRWRSEPEALPAGEPDTPDDSLIED